MSGHTQERIAHRISEIIGTMLVTGEIKQRNINPFVSVSRVVLSKDLAYATISLILPSVVYEYVSSKKFLSE